MTTTTTTLVGNLTAEPRLRFTTAGKAVAGFGVAVNRRWQTNGEWQEHVSFFDVTAWGDLAENVAASLDKGTRVVVTGRLQQRSYDGKDGEKRTAVELVADAIGPDLRFATATVERIERESLSASRSAPPAGEEPF